jgi:pimeloyl-ACP methyl ester carboxylesterase
MRAGMGPLGDALERVTELVMLDGPHEADPASVARFYGRFRQEPPPPPHRQWWSPRPDGRGYDGFEETRALVLGALEGPGPVALLGFSQGAIVAAALAALSEAGELPELAFVVLVGGGPPSDDALEPLFVPPLRLPSLHAFGTEDFMRGPAAELALLFEPALRELVRFPGEHRLPSSGVGAEAILAFVERNCVALGC